MKRITPTTTTTVTIKSKSFGLKSIEYGLWWAKHFKISESERSNDGDVQFRPSTIFGSRKFFGEIGDLSSDKHHDWFIRCHEYHECDKFKFIHWATICDTQNRMGRFSFSVAAVCTYCGKLIDLNRPSNFLCISSHFSCCCLWFRDSVETSSNQFNIFIPKLPGFLLDGSGLYLKFIWFFTLFTRFFFLLACLCFPDNRYWKYVGDIVCANNPTITHSNQLLCDEFSRSRLVSGHFCNAAGRCLNASW